MRTVAIFFALLTLAAALPVASANNACTTNPGEPRVCVTVPVTSPNPAVASKTYYVYAGHAACKEVPLGPFTSECSGTPATGGATLGLFGIVYEETNGLPGLQRTDLIVGRYYPADRILLI